MKAWKWVLIVIGVLLALGVVGLMWWKSPASQDTKKKATEKFAPEVTSVSMSITDIDDKRIKLNNRIVVRNNLPMDINANKVSYVLYIDSIKVLEDSYNKPITVRGEDTTVVELPMEILAEPMKRVIEYIEKNDIDTNQYSIEATVHLDVPIRGETAFDIKASKRMPSIRLFKIDILDIDLNALKLKKEGIGMTVRVTNPATVPMNMQNATYTFMIEDDFRLDGAFEKTVTLPAKGYEDVTVTTKVKEGKVLDVGWDLLTNKDKKFTFDFRCKMLSKNEMLDNSNIVMTMHGTVDELVKAVQKAQKK